LRWFANCSFLSRHFVPLRRLERDTHAGRQPQRTLTTKPDRMFADGQDHRRGLLGRSCGLLQRQPVARHRFVGPEHHVLAGAKLALPLPSLAVNFHEGVDDDLVIERAQALTSSMPHDTVVLPGRLL